MVSGLRMLAATALAVLALTGCTAEAVYTDLDRPATDADVLPPELPSDVGDYVEGSVRYIDELDGTRFYLARSAETNGPCVLAFRQPVEYLGGCGGGRGPMHVRGMGMTIVVASDGSPELEDGERLGTNIVVRS